MNRPNFTERSPLTLDLASVPRMSPSANVAKSFLRQAYSRWQKLHTWHTWVLVCAACAGASFCFNLAVTIWAFASGLKDGVTTIEKGDCRDIEKSELWLHLGINVLSTVLLGGSNYTMQCLAAPTREEINKGHRSRVTLDIGIPSLKNLMRTSRKNLYYGRFLQFLRFHYTWCITAPYSQLFTLIRMISSL